MSDELRGKRIAVLVANEGVEEVELTEPLAALREAGAETELLAPEAGEVQAFDHLDKGETYDGRSRRSARPTQPTTTASCCRAASPIPTSCGPRDEAVEFVRAFFEAGKPVGAICHAPWTLVEAGVVGGRTADLVAEPARPTCATPAPSGSTRRSTSTRAWSPAANRTTSPAFNAKIVEEFA